MLENIAGNHFVKVLAELSSHCSECIHVIQNETLSKKFLVNTKTKHMTPNQATTEDVPTVIFFFWPKTPLPELCEKKYYLHEINSILCLFFMGYLINFLVFRIYSMEDRMTDE
jgi:hypothetical protein